MRLKKYSRYIWRYALIFLCFAIEFMRNFTFCSAGKSDILSYIAMCLGGVPATGELDIFTTLFSIVPNIIILYCFSDFMRQDCALNYVYVFTRLGRKDKWLFQKARQLLCNIAVVFAALFFAVFIIGKLGGLTSTHNMFLPILSMYLLNVLAVFVLSYAQNFLSLRHGGTLAFLITVLFYAFSIIITLAVFNKNGVFNILLMLLPADSQMYIWHTDRDAAAAIGFALTGFLQPFSYIILVVYFVITYAVSHVLFQKLDMAEMITEE